MTEQIKGNPFNLEAAKNGEPILLSGMPAKFIAHIPENHTGFRVVVAHSGYTMTLTEDGRHTAYSEPLLTMATRTVKTVGYRAYYYTSKKHIYKAIVYESQTYTTTTVENNPDFLKWIDTEWQYDEVEL